MAWSREFLAAPIHILSKSTKKSRLALKPGVPGPISAQAVKWIDCGNVQTSSGEAHLELMAFLKQRQHLALCSLDVTKFLAQPALPAALVSGRDRFQFGL